MVYFVLLKSVFRIIHLYLISTLLSEVFKGFFSMKSIDLEQTFFYLILAGNHSCYGNNSMNSSFSQMIQGNDNIRLIIFNKDYTS